ncbi:MAG: class I SAM-dependent methyltransferase, partial [Gemmatimonadota bacterium]
MSTAVSDRPRAVERLAEDYSGSAPAYARLWGPTILPLTLPLLDELPLGAARRVLDVGTGSGDLLPHLRARAPRARVVGVDGSSGMLAEAAARGRGPLVMMDARALAVPGRAIDVVSFAFVLFHLPRPAEALREARRVLRAEGAVGLVSWSDASPPLPGEKIWREELARQGAGAD